MENSGVRRCRCSPDVSLQDLGSGWIAEPQKGPTGGVGIICRRPVCCDLGAPQTSPSRMSALARISEPQRGPTGGYRIIGLACGAAILVLPRRPPLGSRLWLVFPSSREGRQEGLGSLSLPRISLGHLIVSQQANHSLREFVTGAVQLYSKLMLGASVE